MREICTSGSMSGEWKRSMAELVRHRQTKEPETDRLRLNHRATPRLYLDGFGLGWGISCPSKPAAQARESGWPERAGMRIPSLARRACMGTTLHPSPQRKQGNTRRPHIP